MESNIKGLVAAGHEMASELKAECGAVDMRSVAKLISDLATQLEVQLVRANALASLEAEPVAWTDDEELRDVEQIGLGYLLPCPPDKYADPRRVIPLYRVPPAPIVQAQGIEIAINELVSLSPQLDKRAVETLSMAVAHLRKLVKKQLQVKE